ncbi:MAG: tripartite tricarboxylate transporter substrate binding protein [Burkholderiales bacterium]
MRRALRWSFALTLLSSLSFGALDTRAQTYPVKPIRVIDAYPPGGSTDVVARILAIKFQESMGRSWIIDNRPGAQGIIGCELAAKSPPDGYTLLMFTGSHAVHPSIYKNMPYEFLQAFAPITQMTSTTNVLVVHPSVPVKSLKELIALAKARPGQLNYSSAGIGSTTHMAMELLKTMAHIDIAHIPYKGAAPAVMDGVAGHVAMLFGPLPVVGPHSKAGRLRIIAVSTKERSRAIPEIPTVAEAGVPGYEATNSVGIVAPAATPRDIVMKLHAEIVRILRLPDIQEKLIAMGAEPVGSTPEEFTAFIRNDIQKWANVVRAANIPSQPW